MRIAFFSHLDMNLYLFRLSWMKALQAAGHEVCAVVPRGEYFGRFAGHGIEAVPFEMARGSLNPLRLAGAVARLRRTFAALRPDAVDTFTLQGSIVGAPAARRAGVPAIICHVTGLGYLFTERGGKARALRAPVRLLARQAFRAARRVVFQNEDDQRELSALVAAGKTLVIRGTGVDTTFFSRDAADAAAVGRIREAEGIGPGHVVVAFVGRLLAHKGIVELVEAARALAPRAPEVLLLVVGWRDAGNPAVVGEAFVRGLAADRNVRLLGKREEVREILAASDVFALPSYREGTPRTVLEAMAMGLPVVTTDAPGCRQTVADGETGLLIPARDAGALAGALERLARDGGVRRRMGAAGRAKAEREFSTDVVVREVLRLHEELAARC